MKNPTGNKLEKLVFGMFDQMVEGADKYVTKQGSTWLIFTEDKRWVIEFTNDKTLWFNYNVCLLYTSPSPRDRQKSRMPSSA